MKRPRTLIAVLAVAAAVPWAAATMSTPKKAEEHLAAMRFLSGHWAGKKWGGEFHAYYSTPEGGKVLSYSKLVKDDRVGFYEFEVFELDGDQVVFRPHPNGKPATTLKLTACDPEARKVTFENPNKNFPTRIVYHRITDERLVITLTDPHGGSPDTDMFNLKRQ